MPAYPPGTSQTKRPSTRTSLTPPGTPAHSWQAVAAGGTSIGAKGMMVAARTMALTALALLAEPAHLATARAEFERKRGAYVWKTALGGRKPALDYRK